jgi:hypothetical protein
MAWLLSLLLAFAGVAAANNGDDDGFIWIDANTRIKVKPIGSAGGGGTAPAPAPEKKEQPKK